MKKTQKTEVGTKTDTNNAAVLSIEINDNKPFQNEGEQSVINENGGASFTEMMNSELFQKKIKETFIDDFQNGIKSLQEEIRKESQDTKKEFLTFFGLFTSFVTFLSIEVQLFKSKDTVFDLIGISFLSLAFVTFFAIILNDIGKEKHELKDFNKPSYYIIFAFIIIGLGLLFCGESKESRFKKLESKINQDSTNTIKNQRELNRKLDSLAKLIIGQDSLQKQKSHK